MILEAQVEYPMSNKEYPMMKASRQNRHSAVLSTSEDGSALIRPLDIGNSLLAIGHSPPPFTRSCRRPLDIRNSLLAIGHSPQLYVAVYLACFGSLIPSG